MPLRAYKLRYYPTKTQLKKLPQCFGVKRFVWNVALDFRSWLYKEFGESINYAGLSKEIKFLKDLGTYDWLKEVPSGIITQSLIDLDKAYNKFFKEGVGYPKFKSKHGHRSIRLQMDQRHIDKTFKPGKLFKAPGLGELKLVWSRIPKGKAKMVTVSCDTAGRYFASFAVEESIEALPATDKVVGIDLGTLDAMTLSTGEKIKNPRHLKKHQDKLKFLQQKLSRQKKGSNRREVTRRKIGKLHAHIADCRREFLHQLTTRIINENQVIAVESIATKNLSASSKGTIDKPGKMVKQKSGLNKSILDVSFSEIIRQLEYKTRWFGRTLVKVDRFFPSSKLCSTPGCGHKMKNLSLDDRSWKCPECKTMKDRDTNAAINIITEGLGILSPGGIACAAQAA